MAFTYFRSITVDHTKCGSSNSTNFPVAFFGTYTWLKTVANGGRLQSSSGFDVVFAADSGGVTRYNYERVVWNGTTGVVEYHVQIPTLSHTVDTVFYVLYGDATVTSDQSNTNATWDTNYKAVWHLPDGTTLTANDSTSNGNNGTLVNTPTAGTGQVDGDASFTGVGMQYIDAGTGASLDITGALTVEVWVSTNDVISVQRCVSHFTDGPPPEGWELLFQPGVGSKMQLQMGNGTTSGGSAGGGYSLCNGVSGLSVNTFAHIVFTYDGSSIGTPYQNGSPGSTQSGMQTASFPGGHCRIATGGATLSVFWNGSIDEIRVSNIVRSADYVLQAYNNQNSPSTFYTVGSENGVVNIGFIRDRGMEGGVRPLLLGGFNG